jgi:A/G-specific adenine glycosylase
MAWATTLAVVPDPTALAPPLLSWYDANARDLPWRRTKDPYRIWVSEIMLQQTRVDTVLRYYDRFLERFPTVQDLADADEEAVRAMWSGLGFYRRARNLHRGARIVAQDLEGEVPNTPESILRIPGIGRYTAGAILSFAHDAKAPILDGNVIRVLSRLFRVEGAPDKAAVQRVLWALAEDVLPDDRPGDFNQAQMDLGATVCTPIAPACGRCPLSQHCETGPAGDAETYPAPKRRRKVAMVRRVALRIDGPDGRFLLRRRPPDGLLPSLWTLPAAEVTGDSSSAIDLLARALRCIHPPRLCATAEHRFSHRHWTTEVHRVVGTGGEGTANDRWVHASDLVDLGVPTAARKELKASEAAQMPLFGD